MLNAGATLPIGLSGRVEAPRQRGAADRFQPDATASGPKRRVGAADRRADAAQPRPSFAVDADAPGASARFLAQSFAQAQWPQAEPRMTHGQAVAQYPSLSLFSQVIAPDLPMSPIAAASGHMIDLSA
ncbi:MAG: hypothetical protein EXQ88_05700 [Alphaproteobacteria bacterium]|nr:hypothetical protein [Alphaproteobacteria bacterium]